MTEPRMLRRPDGTGIAYHKLAGKSPGVLFCGGFMSDMSGTKALALEEHCRRAGRGFVRFDYRGHGRSDGRFVDCTVGDWAGDAEAVLEEVCEGPQAIVGSSMGGWIMLLLALARPERVKALVGVAPAPDFVLRMWEEAPEEARHALSRDGVWRRPSQYSAEPYAITMKLIEDGRRRLVGGRLGELRCPVRILHGMADPDVPWRLSLELVERLGSADVACTFVKAGDHRLSTPADLARLIATVEELACA
jgi:pimeloyl-ACP methyl ester carboxylesterase